MAAQNHPECRKHAKNAIKVKRQGAPQTLKIVQSLMNAHEAPAGLIGDIAAQPTIDHTEYGSLPCMHALASLVSPDSSSRTGWPWLATGDDAATARQLQAMCS